MIGDYKIGKLIGEGAFSKVKLGIHNQTGKKVAIKIINKKMMQESNEKSAKDKAKRAAKRGVKPAEAPPTSPTDSAALSFINSLENEVQLLMRLDHPNVIKTYQVIDSEEECYVVMQYASGGEMMEYLAAKGSLTEKEAKKFFAQLVSGLEHIHMASIVHRDMKLENLLLDDKNNLLITDFGLGRTFDTDRMHLLDTFCGTPHYAAVELVSGIPYIGIKSDIWALGVILYFMVVGSAPFAGKTIAELYENIRSVNYDIYDFFSPELTDLLDKILQKNPIDRITLQEIRNHKWLEGFDCPSIPPKISGKVDSTKLGQVVKSINSEMSYVCYTFNSYEPPVNKHLGNSRADANRRQRSNSAVTARKKSYSIGKEGQPALDSILGKDNRPTAEGSVGRNFILGAEARHLDGSTISSLEKSSRNSVNSSRPNAENSMGRQEFSPNAESSVGRYGVAQDRQWFETSPTESSPLKETTITEEVSESKEPNRGMPNIRGALGFRRGSYSRKVAVPLRPNQDGSFFSKAVPTVPREGNRILIVATLKKPVSPPESNQGPFGPIQSEGKPAEADFKAEPPLPPKQAPEVNITAPSIASFNISPENSATLDEVVKSLEEGAESKNVPQERRRRAFSALADPVFRKTKKSPTKAEQILEDETNDQPTGLLNLNKKTSSPNGTSTIPYSAEERDSFSPRPSLIGSAGSRSDDMAVLSRRLSMVGKPVEDNTESSIMDSATAKLKLENFDMKDIIAWHEIHKPPKMIRTVKFAFRKGTSSSVLDTATMFQDVHKAIMTLPEYQSKKLQFKRHPDYYNFTCTYSEDGVNELLKFDVEICKVWLLDLHAVKLKRRTGEAILFKKFHDQIVKELKW